MLTVSLSIIGLAGQRRTEPGFHVHKPSALRRKRGEGGTAKGQRTTGEEGRKWQLVMDAENMKFSKL